MIDTKLPEEAEEGILIGATIDNTVGGLPLTSAVLYSVRKPF